jgi:hypothetical protein
VTKLSGVLGIDNKFPATKLPGMLGIDKMFPETKVSGVLGIDKMFPETKLSGRLGIDKMFPATKLPGMLGIDKMFPATKLSDVLGIEKTFPATKLSGVLGIDKMFPESKLSSLLGMQSKLTESKLSGILGIQGRFAELLGSRDRFTWLGDLQKTLDSPTLITSALLRAQPHLETTLGIATHRSPLLDGIGTVGVLLAAAHRGDAATLKLATAYEALGRPVAPVVAVPHETSRSPRRLPVRIHIQCINCGRVTEHKVTEALDAPGLIVLETRPYCPCIIEAVEHAARPGSVREVLDGDSEGDGQPRARGILHIVRIDPNDE